MKIGRRERTIVVEPIRIPVPAPDDPAPEAPRQPGQEPTRIPERELAPA